MITVKTWVVVLLTLFGVFGFMAFILTLILMWYVKHNGSITIGYYDDDDSNQ